MFVVYPRENFTCLTPVAYYLPSSNRKLSTYIIADMLFLVGSIKHINKFQKDLLPCIVSEFFIM
jgi:hypothetical protein